MTKETGNRDRWKKPWSCSSEIKHDLGVLKQRLKCWNSVISMKKKFYQCSRKNCFSFEKRTKINF